MENEPNLTSPEDSRENLSFGEELHGWSPFNEENQYVNSRDENLTISKEAFYNKQDWTQHNETFDEHAGVIAVVTEGRVSCIPVYDREELEYIQKEIEDLEDVQNESVEKYNYMDLSDDTLEQILKIYGDSGQIQEVLKENGYAKGTFGVPHTGEGIEPNAWRILTLEKIITKIQDQKE